MPIRHNIRDLERGLSDVARRQVPFAVSLGINATLEDVKKNADKGLERRLDKPTPFTRRAFQVKRSSKRRLSGAVKARPVQAEYLGLQEEGGERQAEGGAIVVPVGQRRNKYGNMPKGAIKRALARADTFSTSRGSRLPGGIYKRTKRGLKMVAAYISSASYGARLRFVEGASKTAAARLPRHLETAMRRALATARR